ncbi:MAG: hypothetical protein U0O22_07080 [Acutalibacteraceae bacterium]
MEDMLSMIVEMDEKVRIETKQAEQRKADSFKKITKQREDIYNDYINRARERIKKNEKTERDVAEKKWQQINAQQQESLKMLNDQYKKNGQRWVDLIVANVIDK